MLNNLFNAFFKLLKKAKPQSETIKSAAKVAGVAAGSAVVGGVIVHTIDKKKKKKAVKDAYKEGHKAGEEAVKQKFAEFIKTQRARDEFLLLVTKIGVYIAKCDGGISTEERKQLEIVIGNINMSPVSPSVIKDRIRQIKQTSFNYCDIVSEMDSFLKEYDNEKKKTIITYVDKLIHDMINADGHMHPAKKEFITKWENHFLCK